MTYSVGNSEVANYANTSSGKVTNVVADDGLGGSGVVTDVTDRVALSFVVATNIQFLTIDVTSLAGYVAGITDVTITVNPDVYVYGTLPTQQYPTPGIPNPTVPITTPDASMQIIGGAAGDTIKLVNNGNIVGFGGDGGGVQRFVPCGSTYYPMEKSATPGNAALSLITPGISVSIENNGYIAGGGGGGGKGPQNGVSCNYTYSPGGGGGAGGGISGAIPSPGFGGAVVRAIPPNAGNNGVISQQYGCCSLIDFYGGGGGGFVLPGTGGVTINSSATVVGIGGGAGGSGAVTATGGINAWNNNGGSANNAAPAYTTYTNTSQGGGGGGWGATGAAGYNNLTLYQVGAVGGNSIATNGNAYTLTGSGSLYGSVNTATTSVVYTFPATVETGTTLDLAAIPGYTTGTNVVVIVPASVRLASNNTATPGLDISKSGAGNDPSSVRIVLNGAILGAGGIGGSEINTPVAGGVALTISTTSLNYIIDNTNGYLAAGGGGGGRSVNIVNTNYPYGGGGAGLGGSSGTAGSAAYNVGVVSGVSAGNNGTVVSGGTTYASGGSGGTILPGARTSNTGTFTVGTYAGLGGQAGGSGAFNALITLTSPTNYGGAYKEFGGIYQANNIPAGGGGGGWGGNGGSGRRGINTVQAGGASGRALKIPTANTVYVANSTNLAGSVGT